MDSDTKKTERAEGRERTWQTMLSWQITAAAAGEHGDQLRRDAAAVRSARSARASADETPANGRLALDPEEVYPDEPAEGRGTRRRTTSGRRR